MNSRWIHACVASCMHACLWSRCALCLSLSLVVASPFSSFFLYLSHFGTGFPCNRCLSQVFDWCWWSVVYSSFHFTLHSLPIRVDCRKWKIHWSERDTLIPSRRKRATNFNTRIYDPHILLRSAHTHANPTTCTDPHRDNGNESFWNSLTDIFGRNEFVIRASLVIEGSYQMDTKWYWKQIVIVNRNQLNVRSNRRNFSNGRYLDWK